MPRPNSMTGIRIPLGQKGVPLHELKASLRTLDDAIAHRKHTLKELWRRASVADRALAVQRMLREGGVPQEVADSLVTLMDRLEEAFRAVRQARAQGAHAQISAREVDLQLCTRSLDEFIEEMGVFDLLFKVSESFLIDVPYERGIRPLPAMFEERGRLRDQIERQEQHRRRRGPIRMLNPLTMSGNIPVVR